MEQLRRRFGAGAAAAVAAPESVAEPIAPPVEHVDTGMPAPVEQATAPSVFDIVQPVAQMVPGPVAPAITPEADLVQPVADNTKRTRSKSLVKRERPATFTSVIREAILEGKTDEQAYAMAREAFGIVDPTNMYGDSIPAATRRELAKKGLVAMPEKRVRNGNTKLGQKKRWESIKAIAEADFAAGSILKQVMNVVVDYAEQKLGELV